MVDAIVTASQPKVENSLECLRSHIEKLQNNELLLLIEDDVGAAGLVAMLNQNQSA
ncbi:unnamed protein product [Dovyalis caffra]|uniref:Uncharacterized protein n=1 Tax=Dovyalis caffra TaxID=77055 RepID=A0AAV1RGY2_9ROSI|nr:unnamed protein product [Dovyalis caffra]